MKYFVLLVTVISLMGCDNLFELGNKDNSIYQEEKACRDTQTGQFVSMEQCK